MVVGHAMGISLSVGTYRSRLNAAGLETTGVRFISESIVFETLSTPAMHW